MPVPNRFLRDVVLAARVMLCERIDQFRPTVGVAFLSDDFPDTGDRCGEIERKYASHGLSRSPQKRATMFHSSPPRTSLFSLECSGHTMTCSLTIETAAGISLQRLCSFLPRPSSLHGRQKNANALLTSHRFDFSCLSIGTCSRLREPVPKRVTIKS